MRNGRIEKLSSKQNAVRKIALSGAVLNPEMEKALVKLGTSNVIAR